MHRSRDHLGAVPPQLVGRRSARCSSGCAAQEGRGGRSVVPRGCPEGLHRSPSIYYRTRTERGRKDYIRAPCRSIKSAWRAPKPASPLLMAGSRGRRPPPLLRPEACNASGSARPLAADRIRRLEQQLPLRALGARKLGHIAATPILEHDTPPPPSRATGRLASFFGLRTCVCMFAGVHMHWLTQGYFAREI